MNSIICWRLPASRSPLACAFAAALVVLSSCAATGEALAGSSAPPGESSPAIPRRMHISSYRTQDGQRHPWAGTVEPRGADSLLFVIPAEREHGLSAAIPETRIVLSLAEVASVNRKSIGIPIAIILVAGVTIVGLALTDGLSDGFFQ